MEASDRAQFLISLELMLSMPIALDGSKVDKINITNVCDGERYSVDIWSRRGDINVRGNGKI